MDKRRTSKIITNKGGFTVVNHVERMRKVACSFDKQLQNFDDLERVIGKTKWL